MMSCDTNVLYATIDSKSAWHRSARDFLQSISGNENFALCELVLVELYVLLRNPIVSNPPYTAGEAAELIRHFRSQPRWMVLDYPGPQASIMRELWQRAGKADFAYRRTYDTRLALTLRHHGVNEFATRNVKDFQNFGFSKVWDPCG